MEDEKEVKVAPESNPVLSMTDLSVIAERAEKNVNTIKRIIGASLKVTNQNDWKDIGGKPYLEVSGAQKIARLFGVSWQIAEPQMKFEEEGHFSFIYTGTFYLGSATIEAVGTRSSKDPFFSKAKGVDLPASEIDRGDVQKSAFTNCLNRGVKALLGLNNMTWDQVRGAGFAQENLGKVDFQQKSADPNAVPTLPKYGKASGKAIDDPTVTLEDLDYYVKGLEKSILDPEKAKYRTKNESMVNAIKAEIERRRTAPGSPAGADQPDPWMCFCDDIGKAIGQRFVDSLGKNGFEGAAEVVLVENRRGLALSWIGECGDEDRKTILKNHAAFLKSVKVIG